MASESEQAITSGESNGSGALPSLESTPSVATVDLTTELRWFSPGPLPSDVEEWFTKGGNVGFTEGRRDHYRVDGLADTGVKRRDGTVLELKFRLGPIEPIEMPPGLRGNLEIWQRWSPADGIVALGADAEWQHVDKRIVKRRFDRAGGEVRLTEENRKMEGIGCDAEIAEIIIDERSSWSFAFAAFGPLEHHLDLIVESWNAVLAATPRPSSLRLGEAISCGYAEYLTRPSARPDDGNDEPIRETVG